MVLTVRKLVNDTYRAMNETANTILFKFETEIENFKNENPGADC
jgi:hypothetical protein